MIRDFGQAGGGAPPDYDICIVGSGPAGMSLAVELADSGLAVAVLESGKLKTAPASDALRAVTSEGIAIKEWSRERVFGGTSSTWAGLSAPLDPIDFAPRPFLQRPGWPIARQTLLPYYERAALRFRFAPLRLYGGQGFGALKSRGDAVLSWRELDEKIFLACSEPQHFGKEHRAAVEGQGVDLWLDATVLRLEGASGGSSGGGGTGPHASRSPRVARAVLRSSQGRSGTLAARVFVLATGGIENARLLLASQDLCSAGLGNEHDQVGRGLMNHPKNYSGVIRLTKPVTELPYHFGCLYHGYAGYAGLRLNEARQSQQQLLNSYVRFEPLFPWSGNRGVEAFVLLVKRSRGLLSAWKERQRGEVVAMRDYSETGDDSDLQNERKSVLGWIGVGVLVLVNAVTVARYLASRLLQGRAPVIHQVRLRNFMEMEPHPENRVVLGDKTDAFGQALPVVRHQTTALDRRSLVALHAALADELRRNGFGTLDTRLATLADGAAWPIDQDASHHIGTTRMGDDPATSVVNADCRLHGADNVFVAGASVLPTSGCANPTFTLVALAIRLADHLRVDVFRLPPSPSASAVPPAHTAPAALRAAGAGGAMSAAGAAGTPAAPSTARGSSGARASAGRRVLVFGAGKRVQTDVLPALAALSGTCTLASLFARSDKSVTAGGQQYLARSIQDLRAEDLHPGDLVYIAVSKASVPGVLARLLRHDVSQIDLLIDTPVLLFKHAGHARSFAAFRRVSVAEDCATLPWIETVRAASAGPLGELRSVRFDRSAWRYHGLALIKTLLGDSHIVRARRRRTGPKAATVEVMLERGGAGTLIEPRDYAAGHFVLTGSRGSVTDAAGATGAAGKAGVQRIEMVVSGGLCTGFRIGDVQTKLSPAEQQLLGPASSAHTLTSRMEDLKRVGLYRLLAALAAGGDGYSLEDGLDDMAVDSWLEKAGRYRATPFTRIGAGPARAWMGAMTKLVGRA